MQAICVPTIISTVLISAAHSRRSGVTLRQMIGPHRDWHRYAPVAQVPTVGAGPGRLGRRRCHADRCALRTPSYPRVDAPGLESSQGRVPMPAAGHARARRQQVPAAVQRLSSGLAAVLGRVAGEGHQMSAFLVELDNHPGELARLCEAMASSGVNLLLCATAHGNSGVVAFIADDEAAAQAALDGAGIDYLLRPALTVRMENLPGAGAVAFRKLADAGVNVELLLPVRISDTEFFAVVCADDAAAAEAALGGQVISG